MRTKTRKFTSLRRAGLALTALAALLLPAPLAAAAPQASSGGTSVIDLPGAGGAEGIAAGKGTTFFAGDLATGNIYRGDIRTGTADLFITDPAGPMAAGMKVDVKNDLLFVAGGATGQAYVYDLQTRDAVTYQLVPARSGFINDVALTHDGAWFTNSAAGELYFIPVDSQGQLGTLELLPLSGPAANTSFDFNLNGITSVRGGQTLIVAHSGLATLFTVDPEAGGSAPISVTDGAGGQVALTNVDGIIAQGKTIWAVQNFLNQVSRIQLDATLSSGVLQEVITSPDFVIPTTAALFGGTLALPNAKFMMGATDIEVVLVDARS
jgi:hypothetical protein